MEPEAKSSDSEPENLSPPPVTFELQLPDDWDAEKVVELLEVFQQDVSGFDEMLVDACQTIDTHETNLEAAENSPENQLHLQPIQNPNVSQNQEVQDPDTGAPQNQTEKTQQPNQTRFKQLNEEVLLNIETNQYSASTKKNTKWGIGVFNGNKN